MCGTWQLVTFMTNCGITQSCDHDSQWFFASKKYPFKKICTYDCNVHLMATAKKIIISLPVMWTPRLTTLVTYNWISLLVKCLLDRQTLFAHTHSVKVLFK